MQLIRDAPPRSDGLDRADPCPSAAARPPDIWGYVDTRTEALDASLRAGVERRVRERLERALDPGAAPAPELEPEPASASADHALATAVALAEGALVSGQPLAALAFAEQAIDAAPDDALGHVLASLASRELDDPEGERAHLLRALALAPGEPNVALHVAWTLDRTSDLMGTLAATDRYLDAQPDDLERTAYRAGLAIAAHAFADGVRRSRARVTVVGGPALASADADRVLDEASAALSHAVTRFGRAFAGELVVFVFPDAETLRLARCDALVFAQSVSIDAAALAAGGAMDALRAAVADAVVVRVTMEQTPGWVRAGVRAYVRGPETPDERRASRALARRDPLVAFDGSTAIQAGTLDAALARVMIEWLVAQRGDAAFADLFRSAKTPAPPLDVLSAAAGVPLDEPTLRAFLVARAR